MTTTLLVTSTIIGVSASVPSCALVEGVKAYLDARFLTMIADSMGQG